MEGFIALASFSLAYAFIVLLGLILLLNILGLPANWVVVLLVVLWKFLHPAAGALDVWFWIMFLGLAVLGEVLEMGVQVMNAKRHGSSTSGTVAGMVGAIAGAIFRAGGVHRGSGGRLAGLPSHGTAAWPSRQGGL